MSAAAFVGVLLLLAAISSSRRLQQMRSSLWVVQLANSGYLFVLIGYLLGLTRPGVGTADFHPELMPAISMITGWIGFSVGMAFHHRVLRPLPRRAFAVALVPASATFGAVGLVAAVAFWLWGVPLSSAAAAAAVLGATAATSAPTLAAAVRRRTRASRNPVLSSLRMAEFSAGMDAGLALVAGMVAFAVLAHGSGGHNALTWCGLTLAGGGAVGLISWLFLGASLSNDERLLLGVGMIAFAAGLGGWLNLSPAVVGAVAGVTLVNLPGDRMTLLQRALAQVERPALVVLLVTLGYYSAGVFGWLMLLLVPLLTAGRAFVKVQVARKFHGEITGFAGLRTAPEWGFGLISQGHLGPVLALGLALVWHDPLALQILASVALAGVVNEFAAPIALQRLLEGAARPGGRETTARQQSGRQPARASDPGVAAAPEPEPEQSASASAPAQTPLPPSVGGPLITASAIALPAMRAEALPMSPTFDPSSSLPTPVPLETPVPVPAEEVHRVPATEAALASGDPRPNAGAPQAEDPPAPQGEEPQR